MTDPLHFVNATIKERPHIVKRTKRGRREGGSRLKGCYGQDVGGPDGVHGAQTRDKLKWHWSNMEGAYNTCNTPYGVGAH
ncbi:hypothetical protein [Streptomyces erythrochromogenes]|uniref:hypothetical protein n=1 Tax=Streptomyces erythrochromogenes TaxID=285574 RepID=UPI00381622BE